MRVLDRLPLPFSARLWMLHVRRRRTAEKHRKKISDVWNATHDENEVGSAKQDAWADSQDFDGAILELRTQRLIDQLDVYGLPLPDVADWAEPEGPFYYRHLTREALVRHGVALRSHIKDVWATRLLILPLVTALTGVIGTAIGLIAILKK